MFGINAHGNFPDLAKISLHLKQMRAQPHFLTMKRYFILYRLVYACFDDVMFLRESFVELELDFGLVCVLRLFFFQLLLDIKRPSTALVVG